MSDLLIDVEFWKAITGLAWPAAALTIFFVLRKNIAKLFDREEMILEIAGMKLNIRDAAKQVGDQVADLLEKVAKIESRIPEDPEPALRPGTERSSILWVDDFPSNNAFLIEKFRRDGIEVELSLSTDAAIGQLQRREFSLIISDLGRIEGGADNPFAGLDLLEKLSGMGIKTPALIYAGKRGLENELKLKNAGASLVTNSPIEVVMFVEHHRRKQKE